jgi:hypothetical protein
MLQLQLSSWLAICCLNVNYVVYAWQGPKSLRADPPDCVQSIQSEAESRRRRDLFLRGSNLWIFGQAVMTVRFCSPLHANAYVGNDATTGVSTTEEAIRRAAATLPGFGPTDVFYPSNWLGLWTVRREDIFNINDNNDEAASSRLSYTVRFVPSIESDAVVADRAYNELNYYEASRKRDARGNAIQSIEWTESNPNDLQIVFSSGLRRDMKVTKRATERTDTTVFSSEFLRILDDSSSIDGNRPMLTACRTLAKWKMIDSNHIEGIELTSDMNEGGLYGVSQPKLLMKSRLYLER